MANVAGDAARTDAQRLFVLASTWLFGICVSMFDCVIRQDDAEHAADFPEIGVRSLELDFDRFVCR